MAVYFGAAVPGGFVAGGQGLRVEERRKLVVGFGEAGLAVEFPLHPQRLAAQGRHEGPLPAMLHAAFALLSFRHRFPL